MFGWLFRKEKCDKKTYVVRYILGCRIGYRNKGHSVEFDNRNITEKFVTASNKMDAVSVLAKKIPLYPHVCIYEVKEVQT